MKTYLKQSFPWGFYTGGRALCSDGKVRALARISVTADTFFSVPAAVKVNGKTVSGFVSTETVYVDGYGVSDPVICFTAYSYGKNADLLPGFGKNAITA